MTTKIFQKYKYGFKTKIQQNVLAKGLNKEVVKFISTKKREPKWLLDWRLKAFEYWQKQVEPNWAEVSYPKIDFQNISYYAAPKNNSFLKKNQTNSNLKKDLQDLKTKVKLSKFL
jgi:Fe-S cluster assembly scaffold protein SufB